MTMKNTEQPVLRLMSESIIRYFQNSNKKHIILTGSKGIGKSTLARELLSYLSESVPAITTIGYPYDHVEIIDHQTNRSASIGNYIDNHMIPIAQGFIDVGIPAIDNLLNSDARWTFIDELGFLENSCSEFQTAVYHLFNKKHVLAVLRKQSTLFLDSIKERNDVFIYDLDTPVLPIGCVIMASGEGRRFGSNKLMAPLNGKPLISNILNITGDHLFSERIVVTRHQDIYDYCKCNAIPVLLHDFPDRNDTIRLGLSSLLKKAPSLAGCVFTVSDQPFLLRESLEHLLLTFSQTNKNTTIAALGADNRPGNPVLFGSDHFQSLMTLPAKKGGNIIIKQNMSDFVIVPVSNKRELFDIDTKEDLANITKIL